MLEIKIKYHVEGLEKIAKIEKGDWIDLRSAHDYDIKESEFKLIDLGISMKVPSGYEAHLAPRSSTFKNYGIIQTNSVGVIDESYSGENDRWMLPVLCIKGKDSDCGVKFSHIGKNDRICQFRLVLKNPPITFIEVENMEDESRGGFGSTGTN